MTVRSGRSASPQGDIDVDVALAEKRTADVARQLQTLQKRYRRHNQRRLPGSQSIRLRTNRHSGFNSVVMCGS